MEGPRLEGHCTEGAALSARSRRKDLVLARATARGAEAETGIFLQRMECIPRMLGSLNQRHGLELHDEQLRDAAQETILRVWGRLFEFDGRSTLESWVHSFCQRVLQEQFRTANRPVPEPVERRAGLTEGVTKTLVQAVRSLPREEAEVIHLKHFDGRTFREMGTQLGSPASTLKARYYRGLERLRTRLPDLLED